MHRKQHLKRDMDAEHVDDVVLESKLRNILRDAFPNGFCRVLGAADGRFRIIAIDDQFNGMTSREKEDRVTRRLSGIMNMQLSKAEFSRIESISAFGPLELV